LRTTGKPISFERETASSRLRQQGSRHRQAECAEQRLRFLLGEQRALLRRRARPDRRRRGEVRPRLVELLRGPGHLEELRLVAAVGAQERERLDRVLRGVEVGDALGLEQGAAGVFVDVAQPRGEHRLRAAAGGLRHGARRGVGLGHRHRRIEREQRVDARVGERRGRRGGVALGRRVADDVDRVAPGPLRRQLFIQ
jgi:hypothetical protein